MSDGIQPLITCIGPDVPFVGTANITQIIICDGVTVNSKYVSIRCDLLKVDTELKRS